MKKLLIVLSVILCTLASCTKTNTDGSYILMEKSGENFSNPYVVVIDSCEYVKFGYGMSHKGNCKFCQQRRQKEYEAFLENIVIELY